MHHSTAYVGTTTLDIDVMRDSIGEVVEALADIAEIPRASCVTRQVNQDIWHVYANQGNLEADTDGILWFARIVLYAAPWGPHDQAIAIEVVA